MYKLRINMTVTIIYFTFALIALQKVPGSAEAATEEITKKYHVFFKPLSWSQAYLSCRRMSMFLATFRNEQEYLLMKATLSALTDEKKLKSQRLWLGGAEDSSWDFVWSDSGKLVDQTAPWGPKQPDNFGSCLAVFGGYDYQLVNWPCDYDSYYVCHSNS